MKGRDRIATFLRIIGVSTVLGVTACGGGSDDIFTREELFSDTEAWEEGVFLAKSVYKDYCENPRTGLDPYNNNAPYPDIQGTAAQEKFYLRSWTNELYLWYDEVEDLNPNVPLASPLPDTVESYFQQLKTFETTETGQNKDNFHFTQNTEDYLDNTVSGVSSGYGMSLVAPATSPPREFRVSDVVPNSPADLAGVVRGMLITTVDGVDLINSGSDEEIALLNAGLFPSDAGEAHNFVMQPFGTEEDVIIEIVSGDVTSVPVKAVSVLTTDSGDVGYIHFNSHISPSESDLYDAFTELSEAGVSDLVLDLRYNGGGLLAIAGQVGYMIAGAEQTADKTFYLTTFNDQHPTHNPLTGFALTPIPFLGQSVGFADDLNAGVSLPALNLSRVYILSTSRTCSASEAIINGLIGADVEVVLIGSTTCGKPYGFYPQDNCGTTYFSVQFTGINDVGFGEYAEGFAPENTPSAVLDGALPVPVPGCYVEDDFSYPFGDPDEALLSAALQYRTDGTCPAIVVESIEKVTQQVQSNKVRTGAEIEIPLSAGTNNTILEIQ